MPYFKLGDEALQNGKIKSLLHAAMDNDYDGPAAFAMWSAAGAAALGKSSDGIVSKADLMSLFLNRRKVELWAKRLVEVGLWHESGHDCPRCAPVPEGSWLFHDWFSGKRYRTAKQYKTDRRKLAERQNAALRSQVWERDCTDDPENPQVGMCRYCGHEVRMADRKSERRPHLDHVYPSLAEGLSNLVLCCALCNEEKAERTPEEAGMVLLPAPVRTPKTSRSEPENHTPDQNPNQIRIKPKSDQNQPQNQPTEGALRVRARPRRRPRGPGEARRGEARRGKPGKEHPQIPPSPTPPKGTHQT